MSPCPIRQEIRTRLETARSKWNAAQHVTQGKSDLQARYELEDAARQYREVLDEFTETVLR